MSPVHLFGCPPCALLLVGLLVRPVTAELVEALERLEGHAPTTAAECTAERVDALVAAAMDGEHWAAELSNPTGEVDSDDALLALRQLLDAKQQVDRLQLRVEQLRTEFSALDPGSDRHRVIRQFLRAASQLIDLSGRLRYHLADAVDLAAQAMNDDRDGYRELIRMLAAHHSSIGAAALSVDLLDQPPESGLEPLDAETKADLLRLVASTRQVATVPELADFVWQPGQSPRLIVAAAGVLRAVGLPQDPSPNDDQEQPPPAITATELREVLEALDPAALDGDMADQRASLLKWLAVREQVGIPGDRFRYGQHEIRAGDWFLMRNPSPYNQFTDSSPGLFTHVGVVTDVVDADGVRRFVIVDLPERGNVIPAMNVDAYLSRTLHYIFMRHQDPRAAATMADVARDVIGNDTEFDLTFRTERVYELKGKSLPGRRIHTYCAGFLLLCAQETSDPLSSFFPIREQPAGGYTLDNLAKLGLAIGDDFVSPTGALFSSRMDIVARCEPMYDPTREIKEAVYDYFATSMRDKRLVPSPTAYQALRQRLAEMSRERPLLGRLVARANNVSEHMDLVSAAKAAAVIETLDEIADASMNDFLRARDAMLAATDEGLREQGFTDQQILELHPFRERHRSLLESWTSNQLSPWVLRLELVRYYIGQGQRQVDERFFVGKTED